MKIRSKNIWKDILLGASIGSGIMYIFLALLIFLSSGCCATWLCGSKPCEPKIVTQTVEKPIPVPCPCPELPLSPLRILTPEFIASHSCQEILQARDQEDADEERYVQQLLALVESPCQQGGDVQGTKPTDH